MYEAECYDLAEKVLAEITDSTSNDTAKLADEIQEVCEKFVVALKIEAEEAKDDDAAQEDEETSEEDEPPKKTDPEEIG